MLTRRHAYPALEIAKLDALVMALMRHDRLAHPATAAEVIARLEVIGGLPAEDSLEAERVAQSYLLNPRFTGRAFQLRQLEAQVATCQQGKGGVELPRLGGQI